MSGTKEETRDELIELQKELLTQNAMHEFLGDTLSACLISCEAPLLQRIGMGNGLEVPRGLNKKKEEELRVKLAQSIPQQFTKKLPFLLPEQRELLQRADQAGGAVLAEIDFNAFSVLMGLGALYLYEGESGFRLILPVELSEIFHKAEERFEQVWEHNDQMWIYAKALLNIYGVYDGGWLCQVWNQHHKDKISPQESERYLEAMWNLQSHYWYDEGFAIASYFETEEILDAFLKVTEDCPYYMPTKREIAFYFDHEFDEELPHFKKLEEFLAKKRERDQAAIYQVEEILDLIGYACVLDLDELGLLEELERAGLQFTDPNEEKEFLVLFVGMSENTRKWALCGWRPIDLLN